MSSLYYVLKPKEVLLCLCLPNKCLSVYLEMGEQSSTTFYRWKFTKQFGQKTAQMAITPATTYTLS